MSGQQKAKQVSQEKGDKKDEKTEEAAPQDQQIKSAEQLKEAYPELVEQIIDERTKQLDDYFGNRTAAQIKEHFPALYDRIAADVKKTAGPDLSVKGFLLQQGDPFAAGTLRTFASLTKQSGLQLPLVLPFKNKHSKAAIQGYIIRAEGGGDYEKSKVAREALKKCK